jgi:hypothetical protein
MTEDNQITFVTALYSDLRGTEFGGREGSIFFRYFYGIESILKMGFPVVVYCWEKRAESLKEEYKNFLNEENFSRLKIVGHNLQDNYFYEGIKGVKRKNPGKFEDENRSIDLMASKFIFLKRSMLEDELNSKKFFWIDAGLSCSALFPNKYLIPDEKDYLKQYFDCSLFTKRCAEFFGDKSEDKVFMIKLDGQIGHNPRGEIKWPGGLYYIIGGLFGGDKRVIEDYSKNILDRFIYYMEEKEILFLDESVMTIEHISNPNKYNLLSFSTWHHANSGGCFEESRKGKKAFYKIFEESNGI